MATADASVPLPGTCSDHPLDEVVTAGPLSDSDAHGLACRSVNRPGIRQPGNEAPGSQGGSSATFQEVCLDAQTLALIYDGDCPRITVMPLMGCRTDLVCQTPDWDLRQQPPPWWPCGT